MTASESIAVTGPQVHRAFEEACRAVFQEPGQRTVRLRQRELYRHFTTHYARLISLPRRARRSIERRWKRRLCAVSLLLALGQVPAFAAIMQVAPNTPPAVKADGKCSLIEAIVNANRDARPHLDCVAGAGPDSIILPANSQQRLNGTQMLPTITSRIVIEGRQSTISRTVPSHLTFITVAGSGDLTLNETSVSGAVAGDPSGVGIFNQGDLALNDSSVTDTLASGLTNHGGVLVLNDSRVTGHRQELNGVYGGGIDNRYGGTVALTNSVISGNTAHYRGGGIYNSADSSVTLTNSTVSGNQAVVYSGGGIMNRGRLVLAGTTVADNQAHGSGGILNVGTATIRRSTISGNRVGHGTESGGGIRNLGTLTLVNSTVSNNTARSYGGGIASDGTLTIRGSTVTGNALVAPPQYYLQDGGGVFVSSGTLTLQRSIVSGNKAFTVREISVAPGVTVTTNDFNLFGHGGDAGVVGFTPGSTDIVPNEAIGGILLPLADNGGDTDTRTHALAMGSPALNASPDDDGCPAVDQRGSPRPRGPACDVGSFEGAAVLCNGRVTTMVGTDGADALTGTAGPDVIAGLSGDDDIAGLGGNDLVCAGGGADSVFGSSGNDTLFGQGGNDRLLGHSGNDTLNGGTGQDLCDGGAHAGAGDTAAACETVSNVP
ncbi:MAG TPA: choice-of-anchor Q domain-containing protein [Steroidobacteraceae bacterium]|nr:choice-of-anchor Q domain-containing protein [Steroidobacteraceae bacterium]